MKVVLFGILFSSFLLGTVYHQGFFSLPKKPIPTALQAPHVLGAFIVFLAIPFVIVPLCYLLVMGIYLGEFVIPENFTFTPHLRGWLNLSVIFGTVFAIGTYALKYKSLVLPFFDPERKGIAWDLKQMGIGILTCLLAMPLVFTISQILDLWIYWQFNVAPIEQTAVVNLRSIASYPFLFIFTLLAVGTLVPIIEELLFRGFLQTWLMKKWGVPKAIVATSALFALFHYANQQSLYNIQIVFTLFILSLFLGFIYARQQSLWASIALHMFFNWVGLSVIFFEAS